MDFLNSSDGIINGGRSNAWSMTLGASNSLAFVNFDPGSLLTLKLVQDSTGSRTCTFPSSVLWQAGQAPNLQTAANAVDVFTFSFDGTNWRDTGGSSSRLPSRIVSAVLGTIVGLGIATGGALITTKLSGGSGLPSEIGKVSDNRQVLVGTGTNATMTIREMGSGGYLLSKSGAGLAVGVANLKATSLVTDGLFYVTKTGAIKVPVTAGQAQGVKCSQTGGVEGVCSTGINASGKCTCVAR